MEMSIIIYIHYLINLEDNMKKLLVGSRNMSLEMWANSHRLPSGFAKSLLHSINEPSDFPFIMEDLIKGFSSLRKKQREEVRKALIRVQVGCSMNTPHDPVKVKKQLFISQVIEKVLFGFNLLSSEEESLIEEKTKKR